MKVDYAPLWRWIKAREAARRRKEAGGVPPYTDDPIIAAYRFCNVRREDDRVTIWIRENVRKPFAGHPALWFMLCVCRQINWPPTLAELIGKGAWPANPDFVPADMTTVLNGRKKRGEKVYTGAYMISAPATKGADKQAYIAETVCGALWNRRQAIGKTLSRNPTLAGVHEMLTRSKGWGKFMAYQPLVDMRFTGLLRDAADVATWAAAGPGTLRGLNRLCGRRLDYPLSQGRALAEMRPIYAAVEAETGVALDFSDVPNVLCETDKYLRVKLGQGKPRARYVPGRGY
jgi:hypothetical protein